MTRDRDAKLSAGLTEARQRQVSDNDGKRHAKGCLCEIAAVPGKEKKQRRHEVCGGGVERKGKRERDEWACGESGKQKENRKLGRCRAPGENLPGVWIGEVGKAQPKAAGPSAMRNDCVSPPPPWLRFCCKTVVLYPYMIHLAYASYACSRVLYAAD